MKLIPAASTILPLSSKGSRLTVTEDKVLRCKQKKWERLAAWDHQGAWAPPFVLKHKYFQLEIGNWPGGLQHNRAKEGFTGIDSQSYQVSYELKSQAGQAWVGSGWLIFKCPDRVQLVIIKSWTATMWAVLSGYLYMPDWFPAVCNSAWQHLKKGYDQVPCIDN